MADVDPDMQKAFAKAGGAPPMPEADKDHMAKLAAKKREAMAAQVRAQLIRAIGAEGLNRRGPAGSCRLFLGPGFRLGARWNRLVETVKTRKKREKRGKNGRDTV